MERPDWEAPEQAAPLVEPESTEGTGKQAKEEPEPEAMERPDGEAPEQAAPPVEPESTEGTGGEAREEAAPQADLGVVEAADREAQLEPEGTDGTGQGAAPG